MEIFSAAPSPVPLGISEITAGTSDPLSLLRTQVVKLGGRPATLITWNPGERTFKIRVPEGLLVPAYHEWRVETSGGKVVSTKLRLRFLGPEVH